MKNALTIFTFILAFTGFVSAQTDRNADCPTVDIGSGGVPRRNETSYFTAAVDKKGKELKIEYVWTVRGGKIIEGQGTERIVVKVSEERNLSADVEIKGFPEGCPNVDSEFIEWLEKPRAVKIGEFSTFDTPAEKALLEKLKNDLERDQVSRIIVFDKSPKTVSEQKFKQKAGKIIRLLMDRLKIEGQRITIARSDSSEQDHVEIWLVPPGATPPSS